MFVKYSLEYYNHEEFCNIIHNSVEKLNKQINLNLNFFENIIDVSALGNVHTLNLSHCYNITDVNELGRVHTLYLYNCQNITDVSALGKVNIVPK